MITEFFIDIFTKFIGFIFGFLKYIPTPDIAFNVSPTVLSVLFKNVAYFFPMDLFFKLLSINLAFLAFHFFYAIALRIKSFIPTIS